MKVLYFITAIGYIVVGMIWGFLRWSRYVDDELGYYESERLRFLAHHRIAGGVIPEFLLYEWRDAVKRNLRLQAIPPTAFQYRGEIVLDIVLWPLAMIATALRKTYAVLLHRILAGYTKVTALRIQRINAELKRKLNKDTYV